MKSGSFSFCFRWLLLLGILLFAINGIVSAQEAPPSVDPPVTEAPTEENKATGEEEQEKSIDEKINEGFGKATGWFVKSIFSSIPIGGYDVLWVILWLAAAGLIFTAVFKGINVRCFPLALRTVRGKYSGPDDPGNISHFQALATAVSGTVGLGNIAGVAIGISIAGPGVAFWLFLSGFLGMATKFAECTLGVKYRKIDKKGTVHGGPMFYLKQ
ncbi:MAG: sodium:alanine symporter family protein, partial [Roseibacillus sp.]|nr:sodium:alanine symporter family protein [Roseibacillus sp.]